MINRIIKWMLNVVNRRICSVDEFCDVLKKVEAGARYDRDGYITIGDATKLLIRSFKSVRDEINE